MRKLSIILGDILKKNRLKLATAESCTGGLLSSEITAVAGSSAYFERGFIAYSNEAKEQLLSVPTNLLQLYGAVSMETAQAMAQGALAHSDVDIAVSVTGIAGPGGGSAEKPVGLICFGLADKQGYCDTRQCSFSGDRSAIREQSVIFVLKWIVNYLHTHPSIVSIKTMK